MLSKVFDLTSIVVLLLAECHPGVASKIVYAVPENKDEKSLANDFFAALQGCLKDLRVSKECPGDTAATCEELDLRLVEEGGQWEYRIVNQRSVAGDCPYSKIEDAVPCKFKNPQQCEPLVPGLAVKVFACHDQTVVRPQTEVLHKMKFENKECRCDED